MDLSFLELNDVLGDIKNLGEEGIDSLKFKNISIDSRTCLKNDLFIAIKGKNYDCLLYTSPSPRDLSTSRMPSSA